MKKTVNIFSRAYRRNPLYVTGMTNGTPLKGDTRFSGIFGDVIAMYLSSKLKVDVSHEGAITVLYNNGSESAYAQLSTMLDLTVGGAENDWIGYVPILVDMINRDTVFANNVSSLKGCMTSSDHLDFKEHSADTYEDALSQVMGDMYFKGKENYTSSWTYIGTEISSDVLDIMGESEGTEEFEPKDVTPSKPKSKAKAKASKPSTEDLSTRYKVTTDEDLTDEEKAMIPTVDLSEMNVPKYAEDAAKMIKHKYDQGKAINILYRGPAGTGKSTSAKLIAQLVGLPHSTQSFSGNTDEIEIVAGTEVIDGSVIYSDSPLIKAVKNKGLVELQEFYNAKPDVTTFLNNLLEEGVVRLANGEMVKRHPQCVIVATANPDYAGVKDPNESVNSRFQFKYDVIDIEDAELVHRAMVVSGNKDKKMVEKMVRVFRNVSKVLKDEDHDEGIADIRMIYEWAESALLFDVKTAAYYTFLPGISPDRAKQDEIYDSIIRHVFA